MNIVLTGSLGHISKPLAQNLIQKDHNVTVISTKADKQSEIEALGANAAIGSIEDSAFLSNAFKGADIVYLMEPPINFFDPNVDTETVWVNIAHSYVGAIQNSGVRNVIHLSSIGGHTTEGVGMLASHHLVETILKQLPEDVNIKTMRPVGFYYNMFAFMHSVRTQNEIIQNYGGDEKEPWVSPLDIASVIAEEMEQPFSGRSIRYIASEEISPYEIAKTLGEAIGKPDLKWTVISDEQFIDRLTGAGFTPKAAKGLTDMNVGRRNSLYEDYNKNRPVLGKVKMREFAKEFAEMYYK